MALGENVSGGAESDGTLLEKALVRKRKMHQERCQSINNLVIKRWLTEIELQAAMLDVVETMKNKDVCGFHVKGQ